MSSIERSIKNVWIACVQKFLRPKFILSRELWRSGKRSVPVGVNGLIKPIVNR